MEYVSMRDGHRDGRYASYSSNTGGHAMYSSVQENRLYASLPVQSDLNFAFPLCPLALHAVRVEAHFYGSHDYHYSTFHLPAKSSCFHLLKLPWPGVFLRGKTYM